MILQLIIYSVNEKLNYLFLDNTIVLNNILQITVYVVYAAVKIDFNVDK